MRPRLRRFDGLLLALVSVALGVGGAWYEHHRSSLVAPQEDAVPPAGNVPPDDAFAAFREEVKRGTVDTSLLGTAEIPAQIRVGGVSISARNGLGMVLVQDNGARVILTEAFQIAALAGSNNKLSASRHGGATISAAPGMPGISGNAIEIAGGNNKIDFVPPVVGDRFNLPSDISIAGFTPGSDRLNLPGVAGIQPVLKTVLAGQTAPSAAQVAQARQMPIPVRLLTATRAAPVDGRSLDFTHEAIVLNVGSLGDGSPETVAEAVNAAYHAAGKAGDAAGRSPAEAAGESLTVIGDSAVGTVIYQYGLFKLMKFGDQTRAVPYGLGANGADQKIVPASLHHLATLVGISADRLTARDFQ